VQWTLPASLLARADPHSVLASAKVGLCHHLNLQSETGRPWQRQEAGAG